MGPNLLSNYYETASMILFGIGFTTLFMQPNLIKKVIGFDIMDSSVCLFLAAKGYVEGRLAPIVVNGVTDMSAYINPVPAGLVLTGIVVSVSVTAVSLSLIQKLYKEYHTLDMDEIMEMIKKEGDW